MYFFPKQKFWEAHFCDSETLICCILSFNLIFFQAFDPGEVLYIYESPAGAGICVLRVIVSELFYVVGETSPEVYSRFYSLCKMLDIS